MKKLFILAALVLLWATHYSVVSAHFLETDKTIGAVLHTDPDDDPIANQTATFYFDLKDTQNKFQLANCNCMVIITEQGRQLVSQPVSNAGATSPTFSYTFPGKDVYQVELTGTPYQAGQFQAFHLKWDIRVTRDATSVNTPSPLVQFLAGHILHAILLGGAAGIVVYATYKERREIKIQKKQAKLSK